MAAIAAGVAWAVGVPVGGAILVGAVALTVKVSLGLFFDRAGPSMEAAPVRARKGPDRIALPVRERSSEDRWVRKSEVAVATIDRLASSFHPGAVAVQMTAVAEQSHQALGQIRGLAGQASATKEAARYLDASRLAAEVARLAARLQKETDPELSGDTQRSLDAVRDQLSIYRRLEQARKTLLARIEAGSLGLQHLAAQIAELTALAGERRRRRTGFGSGSSRRDWRH